MNYVSYLSLSVHRVPLESSILVGGVTNQSRRYRDTRICPYKILKRYPYLKAAYLSDSKKYVRVTRKKKATTNQHSAQRYCIPCKKAGMLDQKHLLHGSEDCFGKRYNQKSIKDGLGGPMVSRAKAVKQYKKSKHKRKK